MNKRLLFCFGLVLGCMGFASLEASCSLINGAQIRLVNLTYQSIVAAYVQTSYGIGPKAYINLYTGNDAVPSEDIRVVVLPPGYTYLFPSCKNGGVSYDRALWVSADGEKFFRAFADESIKSVKANVLYIGVKDTGTFYVVKKGNSIAIDTNKPRDVDEKELRALSDEAGFDMEASPASEAGLLKGRLLEQQKLTSLNARINAKKVGAQAGEEKSKKQIDDFVKKIEQIKTYKNWESQFGKLSGNLKGFALVDSILKRLNASEAEPKRVYDAYEKMVVQPVMSLGGHFKEAYMKELYTNPSEHSKEYQAGMVRLISGFIPLFNKFAAEPFEKMTGYMLEGKKVEPPAEGQMSAGVEQFLQNMWPSAITSATDLWSQAWDVWLQKMLKTGVTNGPFTFKAIKELTKKMAEAKERDSKNTKKLSGFIDDLNAVASKAIEAAWGPQPEGQEQQKAGAEKSGAALTGKINDFVEKVIKPINTYKDWQSKPGKISGNLNGLALIDSALKKLNANEAQKKAVHDVYEERIVLSTFALQDDFSKLYQKELYVDPAEKINKYQAGMVRLVLGFIPLFDKAVAEPFERMTGYMPEGKGLQPPVEGQMAARTEQNLQSRWSDTVKSATTLWSQAWKTWYEKIGWATPELRVKSVEELTKKLAEVSERYAEATKKRLGGVIDELNASALYMLRSTDLEQGKTDTVEENIKTFNELYAKYLELVKKYIPKDLGTYQGILPNNQKALSKNATLPEITKFYQKISFFIHPDKLAVDPDKVAVDDNYRGQSIPLGAITNELLTQDNQVLVDAYERLKKLLGNS